MIFSIGRTTVSGLNFDPYFFQGGGKARFLLPLLRDQGPSSWPERNDLSAGRGTTTKRTGTNQEEVGLSQTIPKSRDLYKVPEKKRESVQ
jgi:hypothetical protein